MINALDNTGVYLKKKSGSVNNFLIFLFRFFAFEQISKFLELSYMKKNITKEIVKDGVLRLHPFNYGPYILRIYNKKIRQKNT